MKPFECVQDDLSLPSLDGLISSQLIKNCISIIQSSRVEEAYRVASTNIFIVPNKDLDWEEIIARKQIQNFYDKPNRKRTQIEIEPVRIGKFICLPVQYIEDAVEMYKERLERTYAKIAQMEQELDELNKK